MRLGLGAGLHFDRVDPHATVQVPAIGMGTLRSSG